MTAPAMVKAPMATSEPLHEAVEAPCDAEEHGEDADVNDVHHVIVPTIGSPARSSRASRSLGGDA